MSKIHILFDYDDRPIKASLDGKKLEEEATEMNGGPEEYFAYYVITMDVEEEQADNE